MKYKVLLSALLMGIITYLDFTYLGPMILPEDYCYYHFHPTPWWVEWFYMSPASNEHPDGSLFHLLVLLTLSVLISNFLLNLVLKRKRT